MIFKEQLETKDEIIQRLEKELFLLKQEKKELEKKHINLRARYTSQNNELTQLRALLSKEVEYENKRN